jgi:hypothetical protein
MRQQVLPADSLLALPGFGPSAAELVPVVVARELPVLQVLLA